MRAPSSVCQANSGAAVAEAEVCWHSGTEPKPQTAPRLVTLVEVGEEYLMRIAGLNPLLVDVRVARDRGGRWRACSVSQIAHLAGLTFAGVAEAGQIDTAAGSLKADVCPAVGGLDAHSESPVHRVSRR